jgi:hypothetical protein
LIVTFVVVTGAFLPFQAEADSITFMPDSEFSGGTAPTGTGPWIRATFDDTAADTGFDVRLTMSANNLVDSEFIGVWFFNLDETLAPGLLTFNAVDTGDAAATILTNNKNKSTHFKAAGSSIFDIRFDFSQRNSDRFISGETVIYDIGYNGGTLTAHSFDFFSESGAHSDTFKTAAHIQAISDSGCPAESPGCKSGWIGSTEGIATTAPEPVSSALFIIGGVTMGFRRYFKKRKG